MNNEPVHPTFETLSAHFDGEAPDVAAHVAGCAECRRNLRWLRTTRDLVATPVPPANPSLRDRAIAAALGAFESSPEAVENHEEVTRRPVPVERPPVVAVPIPITAGGGRRRRRGSSSGLWVGVGSAAAVVVAVVLGVGVLGGGDRQDADTTVAAGPTQERATSGIAGAGDTSTLASGAGAGAGADASEGAGGVYGGDLGDIADAAALAAGARPVLVQRQSNVPPPDVAPSAGFASPEGPSLVPKAVGTRPCEMEARTARPGLGTVVYYATGRVEGVPVVVLGFAPAPAPSPAVTPVTLLALAQPEGCRIVLEAAGP